MDSPFYFGLPACVRHAHKEERKRLRLVYAIALSRGLSCEYCGCALALQRSRHGPPVATIDHYIPRVRGGTNHSSNLRLACESCNLTKGST